MMQVWVIFELDTPIGFHFPGVNPILISSLPSRSYPFLQSVGARRSEAKVGGGGEAGNLDISISNENGIVQELLKSQPHGFSAQIWFDLGDGIPRLLFSGIVDQVNLGQTATLQLTALSLTDPLPLRSTTAWSQYRADKILPLAFGEVHLEPFPIDDKNLLFFLADHPILSLDEVSIEGRPIAAWALHQIADETGKVCSTLELGEAPRRGERVSVRFTGLPHPLTGAPLTNPADALWYLLSEIADQDITYSSLEDFRFECEAAGLAVHHVFRGQWPTVRSTIDAVVNSVGGIWSADMPGFARLWPLDALPSGEKIWAQLDGLTATGYSHQSFQAELATALRVGFDWSDYHGEHRQFLTLEAPEQIERYGRVEKEWDCRMLRDSRSAHSVGSRVGRWMSRPRWLSNFRVDPKVKNAWRLTGGRAFTSSSPLAMTADPCLARYATLDLSSGTINLGADIPIGSQPRLVQTQLSAAVDESRSVVRAEYANGVAIIRVTDEASAPIAGAVVSLGGLTVTTGADGIARFSLPAGEYPLRIQVTGRADVYYPAWKVG